MRGKVSALAALVKRNKENQKKKKTKKERKGRKGIGEKKTEETNTYHGVGFSKNSIFDIRFTRRGNITLYP